MFMMTWIANSDMTMNIGQTLIALSRCCNGNK